MLRSQRGSEVRNWLHSGSEGTYLIINRTTAWHEGLEKYMPPGVKLLSHWTVTVMMRDLFWCGDLFITFAKSMKEVYVEYFLAYSSSQTNKQTIKQTYRSENITFFVEVLRFYMAQMSEVPKSINIYVVAAKSLKCPLMASWAHSHSFPFFLPISMSLYHCQPLHISNLLTLYITKWSAGANAAQRPGEWEEFPFLYKTLSLLSTSWVSLEKHE